MVTDFCAKFVLNFSANSLSDGRIRYPKNANDSQNPSSLGKRGKGCWNGLSSRFWRRIYYHGGRVLKIIISCHWTNMGNKIQAKCFHAVIIDIMCLSKDSILSHTSTPGDLLNVVYPQLIGHFLSFHDGTCHNNNNK